MHATIIGPSHPASCTTHPSLQNGLGSRTAVEPVGCMVACDTAPGCDSFAYNPAQQKCFLKTGASRRTCGAAETVRATEAWRQACGWPNALNAATQMQPCSAAVPVYLPAWRTHCLLCPTQPVPPTRRRCRRCASARAARPTRAAPGRHTSKRLLPMRPCRWWMAAPRRPQCSWWRPLRSRSLGRLPPMRKAGVPPAAPAADFFHALQFSSPCTIPLHHCIS